MTDGRPDERLHWLRLMRDCAVPEHLRDGLARYLLDRILPGSFLQAVLCADLSEAARRGDPSSLVGLGGLMAFLDHYAPDGSWGSRAAVLAWTVTPERLEV
jgi:hypothetical protein